MELFCCSFLGKKLWECDWIYSCPPGSRWSIDSEWTVFLCAHGHDRGSIIGKYKSRYAFSAFWSIRRYLSPLKVREASQPVLWMTAWLVLQFWSARPWTIVSRSRIISTQRKGTRLSVLHSSPPPAMARWRYLRANALNSSEYSLLDHWQSNSHSHSSVFWYKTATRIARMNRRGHGHEYAYQGKWKGDALPMLQIWRHIHCHPVR